jgi:hypothetical protein
MVMNTISLLSVRIRSVFTPTWGVGIMNSTAFSLLASSNPEVDGNQEMNLTTGSLNFRVGSLGSTRLSDPVKLDPSASETKTITVSGSSVGSSCEVNSPVSFTTTENTGEKIEELDETTGEDMFWIKIKFVRI